MTMLTFICISAPWLKRTTTNNKIKNPTTKHYYVFVYALIIIMNVNIVAVMLLVGFISIRICSTTTATTKETFAIDLMVIHSTFRFFSPFTLLANKFTKINMHQSSQNLQVFYLFLCRLKQTLNRLIDKIWSKFFVRFMFILSSIIGFLRYFFFQFSRPVIWFLC